MAGNISLNSGIPIEIRTDTKDVAEIFRGIDRGVKVLGWSLPKAVKKASWSVVNTLKTSTNIAPKYRPLERDKAYDKIRNRVRARNRRIQSGKNAGEIAKVPDARFIAKSKKNNRTKHYYVYAKNKSEAKKTPFVKIANAGLAQASWRWGMGGLGKRGPAVRISSRAQHNATKNMLVTSNLKKEDPWVKINNKLDYVQDAFKTSGKQAVSSAFERAGRSLQHQIDDTIQRQFGK